MAARLAYKNTGIKDTYRIIDGRGVLFACRVASMDRPFECDSTSHAASGIIESGGE